MITKITDITMITKITKITKITRVTGITDIMQESILSLPIPPGTLPGICKQFLPGGAEIVVGSFFPGAGNCIPPGHYARVCVCCRLKV